MKFVINRKSNCKVIVRFVNNLKIRLLLKLNSTLPVFFSENGLQNITRGLTSFLEMEESRFTAIRVGDLLGQIEVEMLISSRSTQASTFHTENALTELVAIKQKLDSSFAQSAAYADNRLVNIVSEITTGNQTYSPPS